MSWPSCAPGPKRLRGLGAGLLRFMAIAVGVGALLAGSGALVAAATGRGLHSTVTYALFIGGAAIVVFNGVAGGGARGQLADARWRGSNAAATPMPLEWALVGVFVIGLGVLGVVV